VKLDRYALLQQVNANIFSRNNSKNSSSSDSSVNNNVQKIVQFGICVKKDSILPLDSEIAEKIIEIVMFCFEKRPEFIGKYGDIFYWDTWFRYLRLDRKAVSVQGCRIPFSRNGNAQERGTRHP
jgi:hypothetical protein